MSLFKLNWIYNEQNYRNKIQILIINKINTRYSDVVLLIHKNQCSSLTLYICLTNLIWDRDYLFSHVIY